MIEIREEAPGMPVTVYASIGNSDDRLSQRVWADYAEEFVTEIEASAEEIFGILFSEPSSPYQNACVAFQTGSRAAADDLRSALTKIRERFKQDSIAWAEVPETAFI
jgi:hypothetical protein